MNHPRSSSIAFDRLPRFPASIARALRHVLDPEISPDNLQSLLIVERELSEGLTRAANHPLFGARTEIHTLSQAIACLGRDGFHDLLFTAAVLSLFRDGLPTLDASALRTHSLGCAILARDLSRKLRVAEPGTAYQAGLVHDIGLIAVGAGPREASSRAAVRAAESGLPIVDFEETMMGYDHGLMGQWYGERLDLEKPLIEAIRFHHDPARAPEPRDLAALVGFSDFLCRSARIGYGYEETGSRIPVEKHPSWLVLCDERSVLRGFDPGPLVGEAADRLSAVREAAEQLTEEPVLQ